MPLITPTRRKAGRPRSSEVATTRFLQLTALYRRDVLEWRLATIAFDMKQSVATIKRWIDEAREYPEAADREDLERAIAG